MRFASDWGICDIYSPMSYPSFSCTRVSVDRPTPTRADEFGLARTYALCGAASRRPRPRRPCRRSRRNHYRLRFYCLSLDRYFQNRRPCRPRPPVRQHHNWHPFRTNHLYQLSRRHSYCFAVLSLDWRIRLAHRYPNSLPTTMNPTSPASCG